MRLSSRIKLVIVTLALAPVLYLAFSSKQEQPLFHADQPYSAAQAYNMSNNSFRMARFAKAVPGYCSSKEMSFENHQDQAEYSVQMIYAYPVDSRNRTIRMRHLMTRDAQIMDGFLRAQTNGKRRIAWDKGGVCGNNHLDIRTVRLPFSARFYKNISSKRMFPRLYNDFNTLGLNERRKHFIVYLDNTRKSFSLAPMGWAETFYDKQPGIENTNNQYPARAYVLGDGSRFFLREGKNARRNTAIHEFLHTLGAVLPGAPRSTPGYHCRDEYDVMCYKDDRRGTFFACPRKVMRIDCGRNTYFSLNPKGWLKKNWNTADSPFLIGSPLRP